MSFIYPEGLVEDFKKKWNKPTYSQRDVPKLPQDKVINKLFEICYHASFLTEEQRGLSFGVIFCEESDLESGYRKTNVITLEKDRDFSIGELMRLSPATDYRRVLIAVKKKKGNFKEPKLSIWGLVEIGSEWWDFVHGESSGAMVPPNHLTIYSNKPGYLNISRQGHSLLSLSAGQVSLPIYGAYSNGPVGEFLESASIAFYEEVVKELDGEKYDPEGHDNDYPKIKYRGYIERLLFHIRQLAHGGVVLVVPDKLDANDSRITDRLSIKYPIKYNEGWKLSKKSVTTHRKYYDLHFPLQDGTEEITPEKYNQASYLNSDMEDIDRHLSDSLKFIASLSGVDGAVLITDKLRVLGFGCEVIAQSSSLEQVRVSTKAKVTGQKHIAIESYGTRHRSTFRFCSSFEDSLGFIVSQDGGIKCVKRVGRDLVLWPNIDNEM